MRKDQCRFGTLVTDRHDGREAVVVGLGYRASDPDVQVVYRNTVRVVDRNSIVLSPLCSRPSTVVVPVLVTR